MLRNLPKITSQIMDNKSSEPKKRMLSDDIASPVIIFPSMMAHKTVRSTLTVLRHGTLKFVDVMHMNIWLNVMENIRRRYYKTWICNVASDALVCSLPMLIPF